MGKKSKEPICLKNARMVQKQIVFDGDGGVTGVMWEDVDLRNWEDSDCLEEFLLMISIPGDIFRTYSLDEHHPYDHVSVFTHISPVKHYMSETRGLFPDEEN